MWRMFFRARARSYSCRQNKKIRRRRRTKPRKKKWKAKTPKRMNEPIWRSAEVARKRRREDAVDS